MKILYITAYLPRGEKHAEKSGVASYLKTLITKIPYLNGDENYILCDKINGKYH